MIGRHAWARVVRARAPLLVLFCALGCPADPPAPDGDAALPAAGVDTPSRDEAPGAEAPSPEAPPGAPAPDELSNAKLFALAREHLEATEAAHPLLDLADGVRDESQALTRTSTGATVIFTFGLEAYDAGHTATVQMNPRGELVAVTVSWNEMLNDAP